jgi:hypothetical protein
VPSRCGKIITLLATMSSAGVLPQVPAELRSQGIKRPIPSGLQTRSRFVLLAVRKQPAKSRPCSGGFASTTG